VVLGGKIDRLVRRDGTDLWFVGGKIDRLVYIMYVMS
jgi:hypothetical protein